MCRYIIDSQNEGVLLPPKGPEANKHRREYKISSHVQAFLKQFAQGGQIGKKKQFDAAGPWQLLKASNFKLEDQCRQGDTTGNAMIQAVYIIAPNSSVASVSCALPSPKSPVKPASASGTLASTRSRAGDKSKAVDTVMCSFCGKLFGKQGINKHTAKCAEKAKGWGQYKYKPESDLVDMSGNDANGQRRGLLLEQRTQTQEDHLHKKSSWSVTFPQAERERERERITFIQ